jgi:oligopeptide transport system substrate-binding protein
LKIVLNLKIAILIGLLSPFVYAQKVLHYSEDGSPTNLDPLQSATVYSNIVVTAVYDTLYTYKYLKVPYELKPLLATGMPKISPDGLTYTIEIRKDVVFADDSCFPKSKGRPVTAHDFVYSMKRHFDPKNTSQGAWFWEEKIAGVKEWAKKADYKAPLEGITAENDHRIVIKLTQPFPQLVYTLATGFSAVVPHEAVKTYGKEFAIKPVGSGAFRLRSHNSRKTELEKNPKYRKDIFLAYEEGYEDAKHAYAGIGALNLKQAPFVDRVELHWMTEQNTRWNSFKSGREIHWTVLQNEQVDEILDSKRPLKFKADAEKKYNHHEQTEASYVFQSFNMDDPLVGYHDDPKKNAANKALRCAIRKGFDWPQRISRFYLGIGDAYPGVIPIGIDGHNSALSRESVTLDTEGAKRLLKEHGWTASNLPTLSYHTPSSVRATQFFEQFRGFLGRIGYPRQKITIRNYANFGDFNQAVKERKAMIIPMGWSLDYPDAENALATFYGPNASPGSNSSNYNNPAYDELFLKASVMQPGPARTKIYDQLNQMIIDDCVTISGFSRTRIYLWHKNAIMWPVRDYIGGASLKYMDVK